MPDLTIEQRAKRRATRLNNRAKRELPLLANTPAIDQFLVTPESQVPVVERNIAAGQDMLRRLAESDEKFLRRAKAYREELIELTDLGSVEVLDQQLADLAATWPAMGAPAYQADWWYQRLRAAGAR